MLHKAYARHSLLMLCISCLQHVLLMTYACSPCCLHAYFSIYTVMVCARSRSFRRTIKGRLRQSLRCASLSWSMLGHVLSEEQSKDGSDGVSDDGRLTIVQCHRYHRPPSSDLYQSSVRILPPLHYHQNNLHSYHCHYQPTPCAFYRSTTTAPPCSTHVPCSRPITSRTHQS